MNVSIHFSGPFGGRFFVDLGGGGSSEPREPPLATALWLFERNRVINNINHNPIVLVILTIGLVVCVILASIDLILFLSNNLKCTVER